MRHLQAANHQAAAELAASLFAELSAETPTRPLGLATGATMSAVYSALVASSWRPTCGHLFALDEYLGLPSGHPNSFELELRAKFVEPMGFDGELHVPGQGSYVGPSGYQLFEDRLVELGPIQVQLLGLGTNGHIAFNEPGSPAESRTREVTLAEATMAANSKFFQDPAMMPARAVTQGLATVGQAKNLLLVATGEAKRAPLLRGLTEAGVENPLSALKDHPGLLVITDFSIG